MTGFDYFIISVLTIMWVFVIGAIVKYHNYILAGVTKVSIGKPILVTVIGVGIILYRTMG